jgi:hypothetical protein
MNHSDQDLEAFLEEFGFSHEEQIVVKYELDEFRSIPGTTLRRYMNRIIETIRDEERSAFLKGIILGVAIRKFVELSNEIDISEEEKQIDLEINKLMLNRK